MVVNLPSEVAHHVALIPAIWLLLIKNRRAEWWWLALAFGVSWIADWIAHLTNPAFVSAVYPVGQAAIVGAVLLDRTQARRFAIALALAGIAAVWLEDFAPDRFLRTIAWLGIVVMVWERPLGRLRVMLITAFGLGWVAWMGYTLWPGWTSWTLYQLVRAASLAMFCWASLSPQPRLRLA